MTDERKSKWYFGGLASAGAASCTHPLDLIKVHLQTHQDGKLSIVSLTKYIVKNEGLTALYNGLSASLLRQLTYSTTRFGIYEISKQKLLSQHNDGGSNDISFGSKVLIASMAGALGGFIGTPADMINVRMQNDIKLPAHVRRKYVQFADKIIKIKNKIFKIKNFLVTNMHSMAYSEYVAKKEFEDYFLVLQPQHAERF